MLAVLAACAYPFLQLGVQYLLYKLSAFLAAAVGPPGLSKLIGGLGGAFGLVLGNDRGGGIAAAGVHPASVGGGDAMIGMIRQWLTAVVMVTMLLSVAQTLVPEGTIRKITSFIGGLLLLLVMLQPLLDRPGEPAHPDGGLRRRHRRTAGGTGERGR